MLHRYHSMLAIILSIMKANLAIPSRRTDLSLTRPRVFISSLKETGTKSMPTPVKKSPRRRRSLPKAFKAIGAAPPTTAKYLPHTCPQCSAKFSPFRRKRFCSEQCRKQAQRDRLRWDREVLPGQRD